MTSRLTKISPKSGRSLGHVTSTILAVRSAILATAWLLVWLLTDTDPPPPKPEYAMRPTPVMNSRMPNNCRVSASLRIILEPLLDSFYRYWAFIHSFLALDSI